MTLDEAIQHCKEKAKELSDKAYQEWGVSVTEEEAYDCNECAREHEQLAKWLEDYKRLLGERQQGEWVDVSENITLGHGYLTNHDTVCSICRESCEDSEGIAQVHWKFCPNCGADMREGDEDD